MRIQMVSDFTVDNSCPLFVMFHGYGNNESEMIRIINAVYASGDSPATPDEVTHDEASPTAQLNASGAAKPNYLSFRGTYARPYMGGNYWYPDGCSIEERQNECKAVGEAVVQLVTAPLFTNKRKILVGFSQGGYMSYRLVKAYPNLFDAAILLSPSFKGEEESVLESSTRFFLAYGAKDHTIPLEDQRNAHTVLENAGHLTYREYSDMGHAICNEEIADIQQFLQH